MDLVEVDRVDTEPLEARLCLAQDRLALEAVHDLPVRSFEERPLREHVRALLESLEGAPDDQLRVAEAVGGGGVDPVDAELERAVDRGDRVVVLLWSPAELPPAAPDRPGAEADGGDLEAGRPQLTGVEPRLLQLRSPLGYSRAQ